MSLGACFAQSDFSSTGYQKEDSFSVKSGSDTAGTNSGRDTNINKAISFQIPVAKKLKEFIRLGLILVVTFMTKAIFPQFD